jgi:two-component system chemotaxis response regulator CheY
VFRLALVKEGFAVTEANDGLEALDIVQTEEFDALVLDLSMPRVDGVAMLDSFKTMPSGKKVPIIVVTALDDPAIEERAREAGATDFLRKPILPGKVASTVRRHLEASGE